VVSEICGCVSGQNPRESIILKLDFWNSLPGDLAAMYK